MKISEEMKETIKRTYKYTKTPWTSVTGLSYIGHGHTIKDGEEFISLTKKQSNELFEKDMRYVNRVANLLIESKEIPQNHFDVLCSLIYDVGYRSIKGSSFYLMYKKGLPAEASIRIMVWSKYRGIYSSAMEYRRKIDFKIFTTSIYDTKI